MRFINYLKATRRKIALIIRLQKLLKQAYNEEKYNEALNISVRLERVKRSI